MVQGIFYFQEVIEIEVDMVIDGFMTFMWPKTSYHSDVNCHNEQQINEGSTFLLIFTKAVWTFRRLMRLKAIVRQGQCQLSISTF